MSTDQSAGQQSKDSVASQQKPGDFLRQAREKAGLTIGDIAGQMKLPESYLVDIENSDYSRLPGLVFARGWIRSYSNILGLDTDGMVDSFDRFTGDDRSETPRLKEGNPLFNRRPMSPVLAFGGLLLAIIIAGVISYYGWRGNDEESVQEDIESSQVVPASIESPAEGSYEFDQTDAGSQSGEATAVDGVVASDPVEIPLDQAKVVKEQETIADLASERDAIKEVAPESVIAVVEKSEPSAIEPAYVLVKLLVSFSDECWIQIKNLSNDVLYTDVQKPGSTLDLEVPEKVIVRFGNIAGVSNLNFAGRDRVISNKSGKKVASLVLDASEAG